MTRVDLQKIHWPSRESVRASIPPDERPRKREEETANGIKSKNGLYHVQAASAMQQPIFNRVSKSENRFVLDWRRGSSLFEGGLKRL
jgi:hypothetical protein